MPQYPLKAPVFKPTPESTRLSESSFKASFSQAAKNAEAAHFKPSATDAKHMLEVYNQVVKDGRYVKQFSSDPGGVATKLGLKLTPTEISEIQQAQGFSRGSKVSDDVELVAVAVIVIIVAWHPENQVVIDSSGMIKA